MLLYIDPVTYEKVIVPDDFFIQPLYDSASSNFSLIISPFIESPGKWYPLYFGAYMYDKYFEILFYYLLDLPCNYEYENYNFEPCNPYRMDN